MSGLFNNQETGPARDAQRWNIFCPHCERHGVMAMRYMFTGKPVPPEEFTCPECNTKLEVLGREDQ